MRSIWKGSIAFGLVNVPVKVYSATEAHDIKFHQVHAKDSGRIKYNRVCTICGEAVQFADIDKAWESADGEKVILTDDDFDTLPAAEKHEIPVLEFVPTEQIDPILYDKSYFLEPDGSSPKAYVLLRETLKETDRTALVHFTLRQKTRLAAMRVRDDILVIQTLLWPDEVRAAEFDSLDAAHAPRPKEIQMATSLVDTMSTDFDPTEFTDDYQIELQKLIDETLANGGTKVVRPTENAAADDEDADVVDLVAALQRSVEAAGGGKGTPAKKTAAKKAAPRKRASNKTDADTPTAKEA